MKKSPNCIQSHHGHTTTTVTARVKELLGPHSPVAGAAFASYHAASATNVTMWTTVTVRAAIMEKVRGACMTLLAKKLLFSTVHLYHSCAC